ncbi:Beta-glucosidase 24 [Linum perenne]
MGGGVGLILKAEAYSSVFLLLIVLTVEIWSFSNAAVALSHIKTQSNSSRKYSIKRRHFPLDFLFGVTTSSYQYEGGTWEDGRRPSIWDAFTHSHPNNIKDKSNGDVAADSYHLYKDDIALVKQLGMNAYRFSVSWSRVMPNSFSDRKVNEKGIKYYNNVINEAISQGLTPFLTLFHLDLPQALQDEYGGFLSNHIVNDFRDFADLCFREFGDRVKHWITLNEPGTFLSGGYVVGDLAPGRCTPPRCEEGKSDVEPYIVCHNMLLAHATAVELFLDPMVRGDYPSSMKYYVGDRLPKFSKEESKLLSGTFDFLGINYYSSRYVMDLSYIGSHYGDAHVNTTCKFQH